MIQSTVFGEIDGRKVLKYTLENDNGTRLGILNYGGIIQEFSVIDHGERINLVLSSDDIRAFIDNSYTINRIVGRTAGRIKDGAWTMNHEIIQVPQNEKGNSLHGGSQGFAHQFFNVHIDEENGSIILSYLAKEIVDGYPGNLSVTVMYHLDHQDTLTIQFTGQQSEKNGVFNPTQHTYFNLGDSQVTDILQHNLYVNSHQHLSVKADKIPTGQYVNNEKSPFDLKNKTDLSKILPMMASTSKERGFDDIFVVPDDITQIAATIQDQVSGRKINIYSDRNAMIVYTASQLDTSVTDLNRGDGHPWEAVALEAQTLPDSENIPYFGDVTIKKDEVKQYNIIYEYQK